MNIEFHYYMMYLIAARAGFRPDDAYTIAYASNFVDDNDTVFTVDKHGKSEYSNFISQTMDILRPKMKLMRIYPLFHFLPGDPLVETARRKDGRLHCLNTTPGSENAELIFDKALATHDLYRIGIASHAYADTWAHQNFVGYYENFNACKGVLEAGCPNIGHADAMHNPDWPALVWKDRRLLGARERVDNKERFLEAAEHIFQKLRKHVNPAVDQEVLTSETAELVRDLGMAVGEYDVDNSEQDSRVERYRRCSLNAPYGGEEIRDYDPDNWFSVAVKEDVRGMRDRNDHFLMRLDPLTDVFTWRDSRHRDETDWFRFQEAVKQHQRDAWEILYETTFERLELEAL